MGQYIANGIVTEIEIFRNNKERVDLKDLEIIKKHFEKYFCLDYYDLDIPKEGPSVYFKIKKGMLEDSIHSCLKDFSRLKNPELDHVFDCEKIDYNSKEFNKDNFPIKYEYVEEYNKKTLEIVSKEAFYEGLSYGDPYWLYWDCDLLGRYKEYRIDLTIKTIWQDFSKISMEDETCLLYCMNKMKNSYFKNSLAKNTVFFIDG